MNDCRPLNFSTALGELVIDGVTMHCAAWDCNNVQLLWQTPAVRGADRLMPGLPGVRAYRRRFTVTTFAAQLVITGAVDHLGVPYDDAIVGLEENIAYLRANAADPPADGTPTRPATLLMPSTVLRTSPVTPLGLTLGNRMGFKQLAVINLSLPLGGFT